MADSTFIKEHSVADDTAPTTAPNLITEMEPEGAQGTQGPGPEQDLENGPVGGSEAAQAGVRKVEVVTRAWTKRSLYIAYLG
ncbi:MAG: hypothetical protein M1840_006914 [Geoglossum simile]|nr:MAG: hypothetical protein M1840_006914 [Geoglossum simile]